MNAETALTAPGAEAAIARLRADPRFQAACAVLRREHDRTVKAQRYATLGIRHYWLVDPDERHLQCFRTTAGRLALVTEGQGDRVLAHPDWPGLSLDLARLWR